MDKVALGLGVFQGAIMFFQSVAYTLRKYADFNGRASRSEFWCFFFFVILAQAVARFLDAMFGGFLLFGPIGGLVSLLLVVPQVAVAVRRLHDIGRSGKELLVPGVMLICAPLVMSFGGFLPRLVALGYAGLTMLVFANLLLLLFKEGRKVPNRYGGSPETFSFARG